ncbi:MAG: SUMF1/EgtB/PvdO family nonheme iron enzyme [Planctomycetes bacterium]|nr:SUMF1/EgtB/PvdO family nonheme iron enzyme [Planctomycetota bacterium]
MPHARGSWTFAAAIAFLSPVEEDGDRRPEARAASRLAEEIAGATRIRTGGHGRFVGEGGGAISLDRFQVIWLHEGDTTSLPIADDAAGLDALRRFVAGGRGLFLSGAALGLVHPLGIEPAKPRTGGPGRDAYVAGIVPVATGHPIFDGLRAEGVSLDESVGGNPREFTVRITGAGFPAFADFQGSGGPRGGRLLARAASSQENPLVEYALGDGRIIVMGWRLAHYALEADDHRRNLERLTRNILEYLGDPSQWVPIRAEAPEAGRGPPAPGSAPDARERESLELAIRDLIESFGDRYPRGREYLERLRASGRGGDGDAERFRALRAEALLANPLLDFDRLLLVRRGEGHLGLPANYASNVELPRSGFDNDLAILSPVRPGGTLSVLYRPEGGRFVGDVDLSFDAERLLFSMPGANGRWQVHEVRIDGTGLRELPLIREPDVDNYDACYLPDGRIAFTSTATFAGVPCVFGSVHVTNLYLLGAGGRIRQLTVDQDHDWCPTVANDGRILYLRWEYTDLPHSNSRILFQMNPDGTGQMEVFGSNSFFPNSFFYARAIPGHPTAVAGIATGHHGVARSGRLLIVDPAKGRREANGVVQEIPGRGRRVPPVILDPLVDGVWPQFLHPFPLSEKHFLVSMKPNPRARWGIYLADVFDNLVLIAEADGYALFEPIPIRTRPAPPIIPDRVDPSRRDAEVILNDVYRGEGLRGIPRGTVKRLRLITYHYSYRGMGGLLGSIGMDGPWDIKRVLGTVPVEADGSAHFRVPANTPIAVQPLDAEGQALQLMRSWFTAMPGETLSCIGCHESQNDAAPNLPSMATAKPPSEIAPWYGAARGFAFAREVQPVLDRHCVACHDGSIPCDLRGDRRITDWSSSISGHVSAEYGGKFSVAYEALHRYVRRPGIESNIRLLAPMEFHAGTTELIQILRKGHGGVRLEPEAWDRLFTWIDLNAPYHGTWTEIVGEGKVRGVAERRREMSRRYAGVDVDPEAIPACGVEPIHAARPDPRPAARASAPACDGWPFGPDEAKRRQRDADPNPERIIRLDGGIPLHLVLIPAGEFVMGDAEGDADASPPARVRIEKPFWMGKYEVTNRQFALFDPEHSSGVEPMHGYQFGIHGYPVGAPRQPVVRVSWTRAVAFCERLGKATGRRFRLPTEAEWEYACRAGAATPMAFGGVDADYSRFANLGDVRLREFALDTYIRVRLVPSPNRYDDWVPRDDRFDDGHHTSAPVGSYAPNAWGLCDMHGNVWEWTASECASGDRVVRGGSWYDRPKRCRSAFRLAYRPYQGVFNVGFRVAMEADVRP